MGWRTALQVKGSGSSQTRQEKGVDGRMKGGWGFGIFSESTTSGLPFPGFRGAATMAEGCSTTPLVPASSKDAHVRGGWTEESLEVGLHKWLTASVRVQADCIIEHRGLSVSRARTQLRSKIELTRNAYVQASHQGQGEIRTTKTLRTKGMTRTTVET